MFMTKLRNIVHGGNQTGVPSNLRATGDRFAISDDRIREGLQIINRNKDTAFTLPYFGEMLGYKQTAQGGYKVMQLLIKKWNFVRSETIDHGLTKYYLTAEGYRYLQDEKVEKIQRPSTSPSIVKHHKNPSRLVVPKWKLLLQYIKDHPNQHLPQRDLAKAAGWRFESGATSRNLSNMVRLGFVTRTSDQSPIYSVTTKGEKWLKNQLLDKGDERNGEVVVKHIEPESTVEPETTLEVVEEITASPETSQTPKVASNEEALLAILDGLIWDFVKQYNRDAEGVGNAVRVLQDFQAWLKAQQTSNK